MNDQQTIQARELAARLRAEGHLAAAERVENAIGGSRVGATLQHALRDACQFVLTAIEALDPKTELMAEELRLEVDKRLL
jgi:hypothetical protein